MDGGMGEVIETKVYEKNSSLVVTLAATGRLGPVESKEPSPDSSEFELDVPGPGATVASSRGASEGKVEGPDAEGERAPMARPRRALSVGLAKAEAVTRWPSRL